MYWGLNGIIRYWGRNICKRVPCRSQRCPSAPCSPPPKPEIPSELREEAVCTFWGSGEDVSVSMRLPSEAPQSLCRSATPRLLSRLRFEVWLRAGRAWLGRTDTRQGLGHPALFSAEKHQISYSYAEEEPETLRYGEGTEGMGWGSVGGHLERPPQALPHDSPHRCPAGQRAQSELALGAGPRLHGSADGRVTAGVCQLQMASGDRCKRFPSKDTNCSQFWGDCE